MTPSRLPKTTVVNITRLKEVVTITSRLTNDLSILSTSPKAIAPRIIPANQTKIYYFMSRLVLAPQHFVANSSNPIVPNSLPMMMMKISATNRFHDH